MTKQLIINQWKEATRSLIWTKNLVGNILIGILYLVLVAYFLIIGLSVGHVFATAAPGKNPVTILNEGLVYYLIFDFLLRMIFQKNQGLAVKPYLYLPVKRSTQINYLLSLSLLSIFNFLPLFFLIPFTIELVIPAYSVINGLAWLLCFILFLLINCFLVAYIKKSSFKNYRAGIIALAILAAAVVSDIYNFISISKFSTDIFGIFLANPEFVIILAAILFLVYSAAYRLLLNNFYLESFQTEKKAHFKSFKLFDILESYGETGTYISLELKLLLRNKRSRNLLLYSAAMLVVGLVIYPSKTTKGQYPSPSLKVINNLENYKTSNEYNPSDRNVTFKVFSNQVPAGATVFIAGNQKVLREWKPDGLPLKKVTPDEWTGTLPLKKNTILKYKATLGRWDTERLNNDGSLPKNLEVKITGDTTIVINVAKWKQPAFPLLRLILFIYIGIAITGMFLITYGQYILSWESSYFDTIITKRINFYNYLNAKYKLMVTMGCIFFLLTLPYGFFGINIIKINFAAFLYNLGINTFVLMFLATFNRKRFDLNMRMMSQQGRGAGQYLAGIPTIIIPTAIFLPFAIIKEQNIALIILGTLGVAGILFQKQMMNIIIKQFYKQKYKMAAGFRQLY